MNKNVQILSIILVAPYWNLNASEQKIINCECKNISSSILEFKLSNKAGYDNNKLDISSSILEFKSSQAYFS